MSIKVIEAVQDSDHPAFRGSGGHLLAHTLLALARHASDDGTGAYPSRELIAGYVKQSVRSVARHLKALTDHALIRPGDQSAVSRYPADRHPVVYDIDVDALRANRIRARGGSRTDSVEPERGVTGDTPLDLSGVSRVSSPGCHPWSNGVSSVVERRDTCGTQIVRGTVREESGEGSAARQDLFETGDTHASAASETVGIDGDANVSHGGLKTPSEAEDSPRIDTPQFLSDPVLARLADRLDQLQTSHRRALNEAVDTIAEAALPPGARARFRAWVATRVTRGEHLSGAYRMALDAAAYNASDTALATAKRRLDEGKLRTPEPSEAYRRIAGQRDALLDLERAIRETAEAIGQRRSLHECARAFRAALEQVTASGGLDARIEKRLRGVAEDDRVREVAGFRNRVTEWRWALEELSRTGADVDTSLIETAGRWSDVLAERIEVEQAAATERAEARRCEFDEMLRQMDEDHRQRGYEQFLADMAARLDFSGSVDTTTAVAVSPVETEPVDTATPEETTVTGAQPASEPDNFPTECPFGHTDLVMAGTPSGGWWPMCPQCLTAPVPADAATWESGA